MALKDEETLNRRETQQKNDVQTEPSLTNNNSEGETAHTENDLSEMD